MTNQNPNDPSFVNPLGRWDYGPWVQPPWPVQKQPITLPDGTKVPNVPKLSATMEYFADTPLVNGAAYPTLTVSPKAYRFRSAQRGQRPHVEPAALAGGPDLRLRDPRVRQGSQDAALRRQRLAGRLADARRSPGRSTRSGARRP